MDSWILHALLVAGLVIHVSHARDSPEDDEDYNGDNSGDNSGTNSNEIESPDNTSVTSKVIDVTIATNMNNLTSFHTTSLKATPPKHSPTPNLSPGGKSNAEDISGDGEGYSGNGMEKYNMTRLGIQTFNAKDTSGNYGEVSGDGETEHSKLFHGEVRTESTDTTSVTSKVTNVTTTTSMTNLTSVLNVTTATSMTNLSSVLNVTIPTIMTNLTSVLNVTTATSITNLSSVLNVTTAISNTNLTSVLTTNFKATPPKHNPTPKLSPGGKSHTGWLLLALGIVLLICTALLVSTITLACQVWKLHNQLSSVCPAHPPRVNADVIRVGKPREVMETEREKMMEEAENTAEKTLRVDADVQETGAAVVPTAPPADPSSDCVLNV